MTKENSILGIALILVAGVLLASHDAMSKYLAAGYAVVLIIWVRYVVQTVLLGLIFAPRMGASLLHSYRPGLQLLRGLSMLGISLLMVTGLRYIPLGEATAVIFLSPLLVTLLSALLLKEQVSRVQWWALGMGLLGVILIVRPGGELFTLPILLPLGGAFCFALYQLITRLLAGKDHPVTSNFYSGLIGVLVLLPWVFQPLPSLAQMPRLDLGMLFFLGVVAMIAHMLLTMALRHASAAVLAPFSYAQIIFAGLIGWWAFAHVPDAWAVVGVLVIAAGGLWMAALQSKK